MFFYIQICYLVAFSLHQKLPIFFSCVAHKNNIGVFFPLAFDYFILPSKHFDDCQHQKMFVFSVFVAVPFRPLLRFVSAFCIFHYNHALNEVKDLVFRPEII